MKFTQLPIAGAWLIELDKIGDERGWFARAYAEDEFQAHGIDFKIAQTNMSHCVKAGTLRGMHYQTKPHGEAKLMRCVQGKIYDVMVDVRPESPTFMQTCGVELSADNAQMVFIPEYCAHGYQALEDNSTVLYSVSSPYTPGAEKGIKWNDAQFTINWPIASPDQVIVSDKDNHWPSFSKE